MWIPVVLTDDPDAGTLQTVPLKVAIRIAVRMQGGSGFRQDPEHIEAMRKRREKIEALIDQGLQTAEIAQRLNVRINVVYPHVKRHRAKNKHPRRVQNGSGIISEGPYQDPPKTNCEILG